MKTMHPGIETAKAVTSLGDFGCNKASRKLHEEVRSKQVEEIIDKGLTD
jgi:hypothetical protein